MGWDSQTVDAACEELEDFELDLTSGRNRLFDVLQVQLAMLKPEVGRLLEQQDICVVKLNKCLAFSQCIETGEHRIVLSTGMIDLLAASIYDLYAQAEIPASFEKVSIETPERISVSNLVPNLTLLLRHRYLRYGEPLPDFAAPLSADALSMCRDSIHGALMFLLLHELGHIVCGHLQADAKPRHLPFVTVIDEEMNQYQQQEVEADQYALDALIEPAKPMGGFWLEQSLNFFSSLELVTGKRASTHPLALNRAAHARRARMGSESSSFEDILAKQFIETEGAAFFHGNKLIHTSRETCLDFLKVCVGLIRVSGPDLSPILQDQPETWLYSDKADVNLSWFEEES